jgi:hypothetical protein
MVAGIPALIEKPQISPLRYAPVPRQAGAGEMTSLLEGGIRVSRKIQAPLSNKVVISTGA